MMSRIPLKKRDIQKMKAFRSSSVSCLALFAAIGITSCDRSGEPAEGGETPGEGAKVSFVDDVKPLLETHCIRCHNDESLLGGLNLMTREKAFRGSDRGPILVAGHPDKSLLFAATSLEHGVDPKAMPATGPTLTEEEKAIIRKWIEQGADWPEGEDGHLAPLKAEPNKV